MSRKTLSDAGIPVLDADSAEDVVEEIGLIFGHWDRMEKTTTQEAEGKTKVILCRYMDDYVQPYAGWGNKIPFVIYSTHPRYPRNTRLDKGFTSLAKEAGYHIIIISYDGTKLLPPDHYLRGLATKVIEDE